MKKLLNEFKLDEFMNELAKKRQIFHNERDFQFEFAWLAKELYDIDVRLECYYKEENDTKRNYIDIVLQNESECILIELKYKTLALADEQKSYINEQFDLLNQGAQNNGSYYTLSDLNRLEKLYYEKGTFNNKKIIAYYSVLLTNDAKYQTGAKTGTKFEHYFIKEPTIPKDTLPFNHRERKNADNKATKDFDELTFKTSYTVKWENYGEPRFNFKWAHIIRNS